MATIDSSASRRYVALFCGCAATALLLVASLNYLVDPYLLHQWDSPLLQRLQPTREKLSVWGKTYAVARYRPAVVYIGNSRTEMGLPAGMRDLFEGQRVFNSAVSGASVGDAIHLAEHAARVSHVDTMVWGIDAPSFSMEQGSAGIEPGLTEAGPAFFARRALLNVKRGLTVDMTHDSLRLLHGSFGSVCRSSLALHGQRDHLCFSDRIRGWGGTAPAMVPRLQEFGAGAGPTPDALQAFDATVGKLCRDGTRLRLYINPTHAMTMDVLYWRGKWPAMEQWQRDLTLLAERRRAQGCDLRLHDFFGFQQHYKRSDSPVRRRARNALLLGGVALPRQCGPHDPVAAVCRRRRRAAAARRLRHRADQPHAGRAPGRHARGARPLPRSFSARNSVRAQADHAAARPALACQSVSNRHGCRCVRYDGVLRHRATPCSRTPHENCLLRQPALRPPLL